MQDIVLYVQKSKKEFLAQEFTKFGNIAFLSYTNYIQARAWNRRKFNEILLFTIWKDINFKFGLEHDFDSIIN